MTNEQLQDLRTKILTDVVPLVVASSDEVEKFNITLRLIQSGNATHELYTQAYESAKAIPDEQEKLSALMALLDEVEIDISTSPESDEQASTAPAPDTVDQPQHNHDAPVDYNNSPDAFTHHQG